MPEVCQAAPVCLPLPPAAAAAALLAAGADVAHAAEGGALPAEGAASSARPAGVPSTRCCLAAVELRAGALRLRGTCHTHSHCPGQLRALLVVGPYTCGVTTGH